MHAWFWIYFEVNLDLACMQAAIQPNQRPNQSKWPIEQVGGVAAYTARGSGRLAGHAAARVAMHLPAAAKRLLAGEGLFELALPQVYTAVYAGRARWRGGVPLSTTSSFQSFPFGICLIFLLPCAACASVLVCSGRRLAGRNFRSRARRSKLGGLCVGWWGQNQLQHQEGAEERRLGGWQRDRGRIWRDWTPQWPPPAWPARWGWTRTRASLAASRSYIRINFRFYNKKVLNIRAFIIRLNVFRI